MGIDAVKKNTKVRFDEFGFWLKSFQADNGDFLAGGGFGGNTKKKERDNPV